MKQEFVEKILNQTQKDYDTIAADFDKTRRYLWPGLQNFKEYIKPGNRILDLGCGNGKLRLLFKDIEVDYTGVDNSSKQLEFAKASSDFFLARQQFVLADVFKLPFADNSFDVVYCLATLHHVPSFPLRLKALQEIKRVLKPNGFVVMTNWNRWKKEYLSSIIKYTGLKIIGKNQLDFKDIYLPWMDGSVKRYYHAFTLGELKRLVLRSGLKLEENYLSYWGGKRGSRFSYLAAANLVTVAKKC